MIFRIRFSLNFQCSKILHIVKVILPNIHLDTTRFLDFLPRRESVICTLIMEFSPMWHRRLPDDVFFGSQKRWAWLIYILSTSKADVFSRLDLLGRRSFSTFPQVAQPAQIYDSLQLGHRCGAGRKRDPRLVQRGLVSLANGILLVTSPQNNVSTHCRRRDSQRNVFFGEMGWTYSC